MRACSIWQISSLLASEAHEAPHLVGEAVRTSTTAVDPHIVRIAFATLTSLCRASRAGIAVQSPYSGARSFAKLATVLPLQMQAASVLQLKQGKHFMIPHQEQKQSAFMVLSLNAYQQAPQLTCIDLKVFGIHSLHVKHSAGS
jgi:hypothetical protein